MYCQWVGAVCPVVVLTLVGNRSFGCHGEELDSRADDVLRLVGSPAPVVGRRACLDISNLPG